MKQAVLILASFIFFTSCASTYYYSQISALSEGIHQTDNGDFVRENDSLLVAYWFNGENAPIYINIYNKSNDPLFLDWNSSSLIIDNEATSYKNNIISESNSSEILESIPFKGEDQNGVSFIPPKARRTFKTYSLSNFTYDEKSNKFYLNTKILNKQGSLVEIKELNFSTRTTPLNFSSYLTLYRTDNQPFVIKDDFYISKLIKTKNLSPQNAPEDFITRGDLFFIEKESKNNGMFDVILGTTLVVGVVVLDVALSPDYNN